MEEERNPYYFNYLSWGSATCRKCRYATKLKSGVKKCPNSLVGFMDMKGWLKAEDIMNDWREQKNEL